jgi:hypothetical protein
MAVAKHAASLGRQWMVAIMATARGDGGGR